MEQAQQGLPALMDNYNKTEEEAQTAVREKTAWAWLAECNLTVHEAKKQMNCIATC